jgi:transposase-like protein
MQCFTQQQKQDWKDRISQQQQSGLSIKQWCSQNQIKPHIFYYWKKRLSYKNASISHSSFTELTPPKETGISIECHGFLLRLDKHFDPFTLKQCLITLRELNAHHTRSCKTIFLPAFRQHAKKL